MHSINMIKCGGNRQARCATTCVHIVERTARKVLPIRNDDGSEVEYDWLCPQCFKKYYLENEGTFDVDDLRAVCIRCMRKIMAPYQRQMRRRLRQKSGV